MLTTCGWPSLSFSPDGKRLASVADRQPVKLYDAESGEELFTLKRRTNVREVAFSPDGTRLALPNDDGTVAIVDALRAPDYRTIGQHNSTPFGVVFSPNSKRLISASHDKSIKVWVLQSGKNLLTIQTTKPVWRVALSPDGKRLATGNTVWDTTTGETVFQLQDGERHGAAFSPDGIRLFAGGKIWDMQNGQQLLDIGDGRIAKAFSPDGTLIVAGGRQPVAVFSALTGQELFKLPTNRGPGPTVVFSPDGKRLATASRDGMVKVWDAKTGTELLNLKGLSGDVQGVAFTRIETHRRATIYRLLKMWDAETGQEVLSLKSGFGHGLAFSPDGHQLAAPGDRNTIMLVNATPLPEKP